MQRGKFVLYTSLVYLENQPQAKLIVLSFLLVSLLIAGLTFGILALRGYSPVPLSFRARLFLAFFVASIIPLVLLLLPIALISWGVGALAGLLASALSTLIWGFSNLLAGEMFSNVFIFAWNTVTRFLIFVVVSLLLSVLRHTLDEERRRARIDSLTGALNRRAFYELVNTRILFSRPTPPACTLVYLDLDNFKTVNDTFGHAAGDAVLVTVVDTIAQHLGPQDVVARLGGDEFIVLMMEIDPQTLAEVITRLQDDLTATMQAQEWPITFSMGVVSFREPAGGVGQMITLADQVMYRVKSGSKNAVAYAVFPDDFPARPAPGKTTPSADNKT